MPGVKKTGSASTSRRRELDASTIQREDHTHRCGHVAHRGRHFSLHPDRIRSDPDEGPYTASHWFDFIIFGLAQGSIYALIAMGYTMVYGILRMINFAHSEVFMSGPYTAYFFAAALNSSGFLDRHPIVSLIIIFIVSMATSTLIAVLLERVAYRPLRKAPRLVPLITAIGASFFLQYTFRGLYGSGFQAYPVVKIMEGQWSSVHSGS